MLYILQVNSEQQINISNKHTQYLNNTFQAVRHYNQAWVVGTKQTNHLLNFTPKRASVTVLHLRSPDCLFFKMFLVNNASDTFNDLRNGLNIVLLLSYIL